MNAQIADPQLFHRLGITPVQLTEFCQRWHLTELALFGSILRHDFRSDSDIDILVTFDPDAKMSLLDLVSMEDELEERCNRKVDLLTQKSVTNSSNWMRSQEILNTARVIYESKSNLLARSGKDL
jgi:predicted nucleotidyltransferase